MKITKLKGNKVYGIEVKRFVLPYEITDVCPKCKRTVEASETAQYFSYPTVGKPIEISFFCEHLDENWEPLKGFEHADVEEWTGRAQIDVTLKLVR